MNQWQFETPVGHAGVVLTVVAVVYLLARLPRFQFVFKYLPPLIWIFFLPSCLTTLGVLPTNSAFYSLCSKVVLPASLTIFLLSTDIRILRDLGKESFFAVSAGAISMVVAGPISYLIFRGQLGDECWKQITPLVAGWIGGYGSMLAAKESVGCPNEDFAPLLLVASLLTYSWMAGLMSCSRLQTNFDSWSKAIKPVQKTSTPCKETPLQTTRGLKTADLAIWLAAGVAGSQTMMYLGTKLPTFSPVMTSTSWGFLLLLFSGLGLGFFRPIQKTFTEAIPLGNMGLMIVIACFGARCSLHVITETPLLVLMAIFMLVVHTVLMLIVARLFRIHAIIIATASQANVGGVISAPIVANAYKPGSESLGIAMGIFAAKLAIPLSLLAAQIMIWLK